ncbi:MAG: AAA family ATPase [Candidatus Heimdallarchaeota archaeon]|nr:AAA family ATPase [Candidatus Heimdallarchaeota archaeon]MCG3255187.1 AAA family ATPase [Candidatus Heimdallarchaeota archaeon]MCK4610260.1 AAA family ATPase [Candidatus Heimdallarchaeota archaeon]
MSSIDFGKLKEMASARLDIIILHSQKGGPGKTTLSCNIAYELARRGNKTILVDLDIAQPTIQHIFKIPDKKIKHTINDILMGKKKVSEDVVLETKNPNLHIIVAKENVEYGEGLLSLLEDIQQYSFFALHEMTKFLKRMGFRYVVYDLAPGYRMESVNAAAIADARIFVIRPSTFSFEGAKQMLRDIYKKLDIRSLSFFVFNQLPPKLKDENQKLLEEWKDKLIKIYKPDKITFLDFLPISFDVMELGIKGEYIFPEDSILYEKLSEMVDKVIQDLDEMKKNKV